MDRFAQLSRLSPLSNSSQFAKSPYYFVTCEELSLGRSDEEVVKSVLSGGIRLIQLRDKHSSKKVLFEKAERMRKLTSKFKALLIINDHLDVALSVGADGVHLGQNDLPVMVAKRLIRNINGSYFNDFLVGHSTHNLAEVEQAIRDGVDYYNIGPVYPTNTKENSYPPLGLEGVAEIAHCTKLFNQSNGFNTVSHNERKEAKEVDGAIATATIPFSVMGGIKRHHFEGFWEQGIHPIAMVTEICQQEDIEKAVRNLMDDYHTFTRNNGKT